MSTIYKQADIIASIICKLRKWKSRVNSGILDMFQILSGYIKKDIPDLQLLKDVVQHLIALSDEFEY